jgi:predicted ATPase
MNYAAADLHLAIAHHLLIFLLAGILAFEIGVIRLAMTGAATALMTTGKIVESRAHFDRAIALYDPIEHRALASRFSQDARVAALCHRSWAVWMLGFPATALADADQAVSDARQIGHTATLMFGLSQAITFHLLCRRYAAAKALGDELGILADEKGSGFWKAAALVTQVWLIALTGTASDAVGALTSGIDAWRSTGSTMSTPMTISFLARAYADLRQFDKARRSVDEAMTMIETTGEGWLEAEVNRIAGEIALKSPEANAAKAEGYFERSLAVARQQEAKSWELRAAMSMARLWRDQGKQDEARDLLAPVYGWFTQGFDTLDLREAKALLDDL